jgi:hypothetical protein
VSDVALWRAVIYQAFCDALDIRDHCKYSLDLLESQAVSWFNLDNKDFKLVCYYADLEPTYVFRKYNEYIGGYDDTSKESTRFRNGKGKLRYYSS